MAIIHDNNDNMISIRWENPLRQRYYRIIIQQDVFGQWILMRIWGGIQKNGGGTLVTVLKNQQEGLSFLSSISKRRKNRGYVQVNPPLD